MEDAFNNQEALYEFITTYNLSTSSLRNILNDSEMSAALVSLANDGGFLSDQEHGSATSSALDKLLNILN